MLVDMLASVCWLRSNIPNNIVPCHASHVYGRHGFECVIQDACLPTYCCCCCCCSVWAFRVHDTSHFQCMSVLRFMFRYFLRVYASTRLCLCVSLYDELSDFDLYCCTMLLTPKILYQKWRERKSHEKRAHLICININAHFFVIVLCVFRSIRKQLYAMW